MFYDLLIETKKLNKHILLLNGRHNISAISTLG